MGQTISVSQYQIHSRPFVGSAAENPEMSTPVAVFAGQTLDETLRGVPIGSFGSKNPERNVSVDVDVLDPLL